MRVPSGLRPGSAELPRAARRTLWRYRSRAGALSRGHFDHAAGLMYWMVPHLVSVSNRVSVRVRVRDRVRVRVRVRVKVRVRRDGAALRHRERVCRLELL